MHSWGLYNGRYGISNKALIESIPAQERPLATRMLVGEMTRLARLKMQLANDPTTAGCIEETNLFKSYKHLQLFDTLAHYFNRTHEAARGETQFPQVPMSPDRVATVTLRPVGSSRYALSPYPFNRDPLDFEFAGRYVEPTRLGVDENWQAVFACTPIQWQMLRLTGG